MLVDEGVLGESIVRYRAMRTVNSGVDDPGKYDTEDDNF